MGFQSKYKTTAIGCGLFVAFCLEFAIISLAQEKTERLRLIQADFLKRATVGDEIQQRLEGNVEFQQGATTITCDLAIQILNQDRSALIGNVHIYDDTRTLRADTVYFYEKDSKQVALGNVKSIMEGDTTYADRMTYFEKENRIVSEGHVKIVNPEDRTILTGGTADYLRSEKYGKVFNEPIWIKIDSTGTETTRIEADTMEIFDGGKRVLISENVRIFQKNTKATSGLAEYFKPDEKIILRENPEVIRTNQQITGDTLRLYLQDSHLKEAIVIGNAVAISDADTLNKGRWIDKLTGNYMDFYFENEELKRVVVENQATSLYHIIEQDRYKGANSVSGDKIEISLSDGDVKQIVVNSKPDLSNGKYMPPN